MLKGFFDLAAIAERIDYEELSRDLRRESHENARLRREMILDVMGTDRLAADQSKRIASMDPKFGIVVLKFVQALGLGRAPSGKEMDDIVSHASVFSQRYLNDRTAFDTFFPPRITIGQGRAQRTLDLQHLYDRILAHGNPIELGGDNELVMEVLLNHGLITEAQKRDYGANYDKRRVAFELGIISMLRHQGLTSIDSITKDHVTAAGQKFAAAIRDHYAVVRDYGTLASPRP